MRPLAWPCEPPILVAGSCTADAMVVPAVLDRIGLPGAMAGDAVAALQALCSRPAAFGGVVVADHVGQVSGLSLCGLARDAGCTLPILLLTTGECGTIAPRAARLRVTVLWQPVSTRRLETALRHLFIPRRQCMAS
jgi:hypothetical protein